MKKKLTAAVAAMLCAVNVCSLGSCGKKVADDPNTLEIFTVFAGYGYEWLEKEAEAFKNTDWVKAKYPDLTVAVKNSVSATMAVDKIAAGGKANTADLLFSTQPEGSQYNKKDASGKYYFEDLTDLYNSGIPGDDYYDGSADGRRYIDKLNQSLLEEYEVTLLDDSEVKFAVPWVNGSSGIFINETYAKEVLGNDFEIPRTTTEWKEMCEALKAKQVPAFCCAISAGYDGGLFSTWWAQYAGIETLTNYMNGVDKYGNYTWEIAKAEGRLKSLEMMKEFFWRDNGYYYDATFDAEYTEAQRQFLTRKAVMMPNGDWLECEMRTAGTTTTDTIYIMKTPITNDITEKCTSVKTDDELSFVVKCVDEEKAYETAKTEYNTKFSKELTAADYTRIKDARMVVNRLGSHNAFIPSYATAKELAKDFLLFLATDEAIEILMKETGSISPFIYDVEEKNPTLYNSLSTTQKMRIDRLKTATMMRPTTSYPLCYLGALYPLVIHKNVIGEYSKQAKSQRMTPEQIYNNNCGDIEAKYDSMLRSAGIKK